MMRQHRMMRQMTTRRRMRRGQHTVDVSAANRMTEELNRAELRRIQGGEGGTEPPQGAAPTEPRR
jgi:hypothetical protein